MILKQSSKGTSFEHINEVQLEILMSPATGINFWHVFTMKLSARSVSSSSAENNCEDNTILEVCFKKILSHFYLQHISITNIKSDKPNSA